MLQAVEPGPKIGIGVICQAQQDQFDDRSSHAQVVVESVGSEGHRTCVEGRHLLESGQRLLQVRLRFGDGGRNKFFGFRQAATSFSTTGIAPHHTQSSHTFTER